MGRPAIRPPACSERWTGSGSPVARGARRSGLGCPEALSPGMFHVKHPRQESASLKENKHPGAFGNFMDLDLPGLRAFQKAEFGVQFSRALECDQPAAGPEKRTAPLPDPVQPIHGWRRGE